jgi:hypothetical protein
VIITARRPLARDALGNHFIGMGDQSIARVPEAPVLQVQ